MDDGTNGNGKQRKITGPKPWLPGQSGNPAGRPKRPSLKRAYLEALAAIDPNDKAGQRKIVASLAKRAVEVALQGGDADSIRALKEIREATEGRSVRVSSSATISDFFGSRFGLYSDPAPGPDGDSPRNRIAEHNGSGGECGPTNGQNGNGVNPCK